MIYTIAFLFHVSSGLTPNINSTQGFLIYYFNHERREKTKIRFIRPRSSLGHNNKQRGTRSTIVPCIVTIVVRDSTKEIKQRKHLTFDTMWTAKENERKTTRRNITAGVVLAATFFVLAVFFAFPNTAHEAQLAATQTKTGEIAVEDEAAVTKNQTWWEPLVDRYAKPYLPVENPDEMEWCDKNEDDSGFWYVKVPKTGSSTVAGINIQLANSKGCPEHSHHGFGYATQKMEPSFLWTVIREPGSRTVSYYYHFQVGRKGAPEDPDLQKWNRLKNDQLHYVSKTSHDGKAMSRYEPIRKASHAEVLEMLEEDVLNRYQFIGITERMAETMVVLQLLYGFNEVDMVDFSSKRAGSFDGGGKGTCYAIPPAPKSGPIYEKTQKYLQNEFHIDNYDYLLHAIVNRSLDLTIEQLGRERFDKALARYHHLHDVAEEMCMEEHTVFPCVEHLAPPRPEARKNCYYHDVGCGHECIKRSLGEYIEKEQQQQVGEP